MLSIHVLTCKKKKTSLCKPQALNQMQLIMLRSVAAADAARGKHCSEHQEVARKSLADHADECVCCNSQIEVPVQTKQLCGKGQQLQLIVLTRSWLLERKDSQAVSRQKHKYVCDCVATCMHRL